jgi:hypothetical protein
MNTVLFFHFSETFTERRKVANRIVSRFPEISQIRTKPLRQARCLQHLNRGNFIEFLGIYETCSRKFTNRDEVRESSPEGIGHVPIKQIISVLECLLLQDSEHSICVFVKIIKREYRGSSIRANQPSQGIEIPNSQRGTAFVQFIEIRMKHSLDAKAISSQLQRYKFTVAKLALLVRNPHLVDGQPRSNDCSTATYERLKIIYEVSPAVAVLTSDAARQTENHRQNDCRSNCNENQGEQTSLVKFRHRFPLKPATRQNRSHFFQSMESKPARFAG